MHENLSKARSSATWVAALAGVAAPLAVACGGGNAAPASAPGNAPMAGAMGQPPAPGAYPPGYPAATPPPGYPAAPNGYAAPAPAPTYAQAAPPQPAYGQSAYGPAPAGYPPPAAPAGPAGYPAPAAQPAAPGAPAAAPAGSQGASGPLAPTDPGSLQSILAGLQGALQGTLVAPGAVPSDLTEAGLKVQAARMAPQMQPEGAELKQNLPEGQHAVMMVTLQAGKCYSIVGFSPPGGVKDLDLNLLAPPLYLTLAGQDLTHNNTPTIGGSPSPMCPVLAFPLQYKLDVFARSGSGQVAVQLYSKTKS